MLRTQIKSMFVVLLFAYPHRWKIYLLAIDKKIVFAYVHNTKAQHVDNEVDSFSKYLLRSNWAVRVAQLAELGLAFQWLEIRNITLEDRVIEMEYVNLPFLQLITKLNYEGRSSTWSTRTLS